VFTPVSEFIDPVFAKTSPKGSFSIIESERFGLVLAKTAVFATQGSINSGTGVLKDKSLRLIKKYLASLRKFNLAVIYTRGPA
jgi:hypothetical protein